MTEQRPSEACDTCSEYDCPGAQRFKGICPRSRQAQDLAPRPEPPMPEAALQAALEAGELPGTPSEARALESAYRSGWNDAIVAVLAEIYNKQADWTLSILARVQKMSRTSPSEGNE